jgi:CRISPR-associated protein Cas2
MMVVLVVEKAPDALRGELTRWLVETRAGVYVGKVSALVRDKLWIKVQEQMRHGSGASMIFPVPTEQGFHIWNVGKTSYKVVEVDGLILTKKPHKDPASACKKLGAIMPHYNKGEKPVRPKLPDIEV